jgi:hypothetical protein
MADANFWYESNGEQKGPVSAAQLKGLANSGELQPTDMIWKEGAPDWVTAGSVKGLFPEGVAAAAGATSAPPETAGPTFQARSSSQGMYGAAPDFRQATAAAKEASQEAVNAVKILITDPIGGIAKAYDSLGPGKALSVGIVFIVAFFIAELIAAILGSSGLPGASAGYGGGFTFKGYMRELLSSAAMVGTFLGMCVLLRTTCRSSAKFAADVFLIGVSLLPFTILTLILGLFAAILKPGFFYVLLNVDLVIFALAFTVFLMFSGLTKIYGATERVASLWVPLILLAGVDVSFLIAYLFS